MNATPKQIKAIYAAIHRLGLAGEKETLVAAFSSDRTEKVSELTSTEASQFIQTLLKRDKADAMRKKIISMAHQLWWRDDAGKADLKRIDAWCENYGAFKKKLNEHSINELPKLVTQFERFYKRTLEGLE